VDKCNATALGAPTRDRDNASRVVRDDGRVFYFCTACRALHPAHLFQPNGECKLVLWKKAPSVQVAADSAQTYSPRDHRSQDRRQRRVPKPAKACDWPLITPRK
jgi:hypothetical protein